MTARSAVTLACIAFTVAFAVTTIDLRATIGVWPACLASGVATIAIWKWTERAR